MKIHLIENKLDRLEKLFPEVMKIISDTLKNKEIQKHLFSAVTEYKRLKTDILFELRNESIYSIDNKYQKKLRERLQKLTIHGDHNLPTEFLEGLNKEAKIHLMRFLGPELSHKQEEIMLDEIHAHFSTLEYVSNKIQTSILILNKESIPKILHKFVDEIRECLAFERYLATSILLRSTFEIAIEDLCKENKLDNLSETDFWNVKSRFWDNIIRKGHINSYDHISIQQISLLEKIDLLCLLEKFEPFNNDCHSLRKKTNPIIHGKINLDYYEVERLTNKTFQLIYSLYEAN